MSSAAKKSEPILLRKRLPLLAILALLLLISVTDSVSGQSPPTVIITKELRYVVNGEEIAKEELETRLKTLMNERMDKKVVLDVDRDVPTQETIDVFYMMKVNGWQPFIATKPKEE